MGRLGTPEILLILLLVLILFGATRMPDAARGLGRSLRIFKAETKGLIEDDKPTTVEPLAAEVPPAQPAAPPTKPVTPAAPPQE